MAPNTGQGPCTVIGFSESAAWPLDVVKAGVERLQTLRVGVAQDLVVERRDLATLLRPPALARRRRLADKITAVVMKRQMRLGLVSAYVNITIRSAVIGADMPSRSPAEILCHRLAEISADAQKE